MSTDFRTALEQWRDLADTDLLCPENPAETDWGAVVAAIAATRAALAQSRGEGLTNDEALRRGRSAIEAALPLPANYIDSQHKGQDRELLQAFYRACQAEGGTADEIHLRGIRAVLAARPAAPPAPEAGEVAELAGWLNQEAADQHPVTSDALPHDMRDALLDASEHLFRAATLLQQQEARIAGLRLALADCGRAVGASISDDCSDDFLLQVPAEVRLAVAKAAQAVVPVAVSERLPGPEDCDEDGFCWMGYGYRLPGEDERDSYAIWMLMPLEESNGEVWCPAHAIPLPQAGGGEDMSKPLSPAAQAVLDAFHRELPPDNQAGGLAAAFRAASDRTECLIGDNPHPRFAEGVDAARALLDSIASKPESSNA